MKQPLSDSSCPASVSHGNHHLGSYEPTSVLDPIATSSGSPATAAGAPANGSTQQHVQATPHHPPDDWDALSWLLSPDHIKDGAGELFSINVQHSSTFDVLADPFDPYCSPPEECYEPHLRAAAEAVWSGDSVAANGMLARLTQAIQHPPRTSQQRAASHFAEALQSLLAAPDQFLVQAERPAMSAADVIRRIGAQRAFACLSPIPQFASFTANQTLLEAFEAAAAPFHIIDFDLGLGGQWSSFVEEVAARSQHATPAVRVTAVVHEETAETLLAADNLRDFACGLGVRFAIDVVRLDALAIGNIRATGDEAVAVVLSPAIFRHLAATRPDASDALLEFIRRTDPRVVVLVDAEVALGAAEGVAPLMRSVESCEVLTGSIEAAAAAVGAGEDAVRRVDRGVVRERAYAAVRSWWSRCEPWKQTVVRARWAPAALSDLATAQAEWIVRRAPVEGYHVVQRDGALVLCWHGYDLAATSAWRPTPIWFSFLRRHFYQNFVPLPKMLIFLCCQEDETVEHLSLQCSYTREVSYHLLLPPRMHKHTPRPADCLEDWWPKLSRATPKQNRKEMNALVTLAARELWLERNARVFDKVAVMPMELVRRIKAEFELWKKAKLCGRGHHRGIT